MLVLLTLLSTTVAYGSPVTDCPCVSPWTCGTTPYGSHALDIATFGLIPSCPVLGTVRCCPRDGLEKNSPDLIEETSKASIDSNNVDVECDCVPLGICWLHFVTSSSDCDEFEELCCIPNSEVNSAVELFAAELVDNDDNENVDALVDNDGNENVDALFDSTNYDVISVNDNFVASHSKPPELPGEHVTEDDTEERTLPCVPGLMCSKLYGFHPLDIARFGALPHCSRRGLVRCVELKSPSSGQPHFFTHKEGNGNAYILPCVPVYKCDKIYGPDPLDIAKFGALTHCARYGFVRCVQVKDTTGSTPNTSPSVILSDEQAQPSTPSPSPPSLIVSDMQAQSSSASPSLIVSDMHAQSSSASPSLIVSDMHAQPSLASPPLISDIEAQSSSAFPSLIISDMQDQSSLPSLITSDMQAQSSPAVHYHTDEYGNQDFSSSDIQDVGEHGNSNNDERAAAVILKPEGSIADVFVANEVTEYTPIAIDGNNVISEGVNLQIHIPTELIGTDIHRLIKNLLALRVNSNALPVSSEIRQKSDQFSNSDDVIHHSILANVEDDAHHNNGIKSDLNKLLKPDHVEDVKNLMKRDNFNNGIDVVKSENGKHPSGPITHDQVMNSNELIGTEGDTNDIHPDKPEDVKHSESSINSNAKDDKLIIRDSNKDFWFLSKISNLTTNLTNT